MKKHTTIELHKENMKFSAGHFTIFSATEREPLHGHNYNVYVALTTEVNEDGLNFDYRVYKQQIYTLCKQLSQTFLLPTKSRYLKLEEQDDWIIAHFNDEKIPFLKKDVTLLELPNVTVEELSQWFVDKLTENKQQLQDHHIQEVLVKVYSGPGQSGSAHTLV
jgi:6-pyruvoyltetrahydropterin/6-carboxytetrahydropterin synthase